MDAVRWMAIILALVVVPVVFSAGWDAIGREAYYRGIYEQCVRSQVMNGIVTQFDLRTCEAVENRARRENWMHVKIVRP